MLNSPLLVNTIKSVKDGCHKSFSLLLEQYRPLIESKGNQYKEALDFDELRQICTIALYKAALSFNCEQDNVTFGRYAAVCMNNAIIDEIRSENRHSEKIGESSDMPDEICSSAEDELIATEDYKALTDKIRNSLSAYEIEIFSMYLSGLSYRDMANIVSKSEKSVSTALERAKGKLKTICRK